MPEEPTKKYSTDSVLSVYKATSFLQRLRGLLARKQLSASEALMIAPCRDVHTFGMRYTLDVAFCSADGEVLKQVRLPPNRVSVCKDATCVFEFSENNAQKHGFTVGNRIEKELINGCLVKPISKRI